MKTQWKKWLVPAIAAVALTGCPDGGNGGEDAGTDAGQQLDENVIVNFTIDASGRPDFYADGDLEWKGAFELVSGTDNQIQPDSNWDGPFPKLWDDGPVSAGGHEPEGAVAGDDKFGVQLLFARPEEDITLEYGAQIADGAKGCTGGCWIWPAGDNGSFTVTPTSEEITAEGLTLTPEGPYDVRLTLDTNALATGFVLDSGETVTVKGGAINAWSNDLAYDDGTHGDAQADDGIYTYVLSENPNRLKLAGGTVVEFIWNIGDQEYKTGDNGETAGATAAYKHDTAADWTTATITTGGNPRFTLPE